MSIARRLLMVPLVLPISAALSESRLESYASDVGTALGKAAAALQRASAPPPPAVVTPATPVVEEVPEAATLARSDHGKKKSRRPVARARETKTTGSLNLGKDTVLRLARAGVVPSGSPTGATAARPGGLVLGGVGALGIGLSDGDVLTEVDGIAVLSEGQVVAIVLGARSRHAEQIRAVVWRARSGERWSVVVAMP